MELIHKADGKWYFCMDALGVPFAESIDYGKKIDACYAALTNSIEWEFIASDKSKKPIE